MPRIPGAPRPCPQCGRAFTGPIKQRCCSRSCGQLRRNAGQPKRSARMCEVCRATYRATFSAQRTCSRPCGVALRKASGRAWAPRPRKLRQTAYPSSTIYIVQCAGCTAQFVCRSARGRWCSDRCRWKADRQRRRQPRKPINRECASCGHQFATMVRSQIYCSRPCARRDRRHYRERARRAGVKYEPINKRRVYERDKWRCGICRRKVNPKLRYPNSLCASLDHIVPLSLGGNHEYSNVQCSHYKCNTDKNAGSALEQLALIG